MKMIFNKGLEYEKRKKHRTKRNTKFKPLSNLIHFASYFAENIIILVYITNSAKAILIFKK